MPLGKSPAEKAAEEEEAKLLKEEEEEEKSLIKDLKQKMWEQFEIFGETRIAEDLDATRQEFVDNIWADQESGLEGGTRETVESTDQLRAPFDAWFDVYVMRMIRNFCPVRDP